MFENRNIRLFYLKTYRKTKDFLLSAKSREFFVFLFFFVVAAGFWLLQTLNNDYETEFSVPVKLRNVPDDVVLISEPASEVRVRVKDKGTVLLNYMLGKSFYPLVIDFEEYKGTESNHVRIYSSQYQKKISAQLNASTQLLSMKPDTLEYYYSTGASKKVPVALQGKVSAGMQYYLPDTVFTPDSVWVYASSDILDTITKAYTQPIVLENISDTLQRQVVLSARRGTKFVPASVSLMLPVDIYTEKTVEVSLQGVNFPPDKALRVFPSKIKITFQIGLSRFRQVTADDFHLHVSYAELLELGTDKYTVKLEDCPEGVSHVRFNPEQVDFLIEQITDDASY